MASDAKRWRGDWAAAALEAAEGQRIVAEALGADDVLGACGAASRWNLRDLAARLQLQRAKSCFYDVRMHPPHPQFVSTLIPILIKQICAGLY